MAKFYGPVGYAVKEETAPGVWEDKIVEYHYYGDLVRNTRRLQTSESLNDDINVANEISIVADPFARKNFHKMSTSSLPLIRRWSMTVSGMSGTA